MALACFPQLARDVPRETRAMILIGDWAPGTKHTLLPRYAATTLGNLEGPVLPCGHALAAAPKTGPNLFASELPNETGPFVFTLANNHLMDYGVPGLEATLKALEKKEFTACGAGQNVQDARRPIIVRDHGVTVGIIACCEAQFGVARGNTAGVAEFGSWIYRAIRDLRETVDAVIVSVHAAIEDSPWPSPYIRELYQSFIDAGAAVVHGHHAHVPQGCEAYGNGVIFYGMGNFAVDPEKWRDYPNGMWSVGADIDFRAKPLRWRLLTFEIREESGANAIRVEESTPEEKVGRLRCLELCNRPLADPDLFAGLWQEVALRAYHHYGAHYMRFASGPTPRGGCRAKVRKSLSMLKHALLKRLPTATHPSRHDYLLWYNMVACESHRQMLSTALGIRGGEIEDLRTDATRRLADETMSW